MQFKLNKSWTSVSIHRYVGYDRAKARAKIEQVGVILLTPEVPEEIPVSLAARLTHDQNVETLLQLDTIRTKKPRYVLESAVAQATELLGKVRRSVSPGFRLEADAVEKLRVAMVDVAEALSMQQMALPPGTASTSAALGPVDAALAGVNALVDASGSGLEISREDAKELQQQLGLLCDLFGDERGEGTRGNQASPQ